MFSLFTLFCDPLWHVVLPSTLKKSIYYYYSISRDSFCSCLQQVECYSRELRFFIAPERLWSETDYALMAKRGSACTEVGLKSCFEIFRRNVIVLRGEQTSPRPNLTPPSQNVLSSPETRLCLPSLLCLSFFAPLSFWHSTAISHVKKSLAKYDRWNIILPKVKLVLKSTSCYHLSHL